MARETFLSVPVVVVVDAVDPTGEAIALIAKGCHGSLQNEDGGVFDYRFNNPIQALQFQWEVLRLRLSHDCFLFYPHEIVSEHRLQVESVGRG